MVVASTATNAQKAGSLETDIDALASTLYPADGPAEVILVTKAGAPVYRKAFGVYEGRRVFEHGGGIQGFTCDVIRIDGDDVFVAF